VCCDHGWSHCARLSRARGKGRGDRRPGTKRRAYLEQNAGAVEVELTAEELARIDAELPDVAGERYNEAGMAGVNL